MRKIYLFVKPSVGEFAQGPIVRCVEVWILGEKCIIWRG
jgi:hypothetical protein